MVPTKLYVSLHIFKESTSCIDLIFIDQPSFVSDNRVYGSLHSSCHHQIILCTFNLNIVYHPLYQSLLWNYKKDDVSNIEKALQLVN